MRISSFLLAQQLTERIRFRNAELRTQTMTTRNSARRPRVQNHEGRREGLLQARVSRDQSGGFAS
jgi:hypothetical protein